MAPGVEDIAFMATLPSNWPSRGGIFSVVSSVSYLVRSTEVELRLRCSSLWSLAGLVYEFGRGHP